MGKVTFGQSKTRAEKTAVATAKGYDSGKLSIGAAKPVTKVKPKINSKRVGATVEMKW